MNINVRWPIRYMQFFSVSQIFIIGFHRGVKPSTAGKNVSTAVETCAPRSKRFHRGYNVSTAVETCYEILGNRKNLHVPYGPLYQRDSLHKNVLIGNTLTEYRL